MALYKCPICGHENEKNLGDDNKYRCDKCTRIVRAIKAPRKRRTKEQIEADKAIEEAKKQRAEAKKADLNGDGKVDEKDVEIVEKAAKSTKKKRRGRKKKDEQKD